jgi:hypothetical protein
VSPVGEKRRRRRLVVWLLVTLCVVADLIGVGVLRASGASGLGAPVISTVGLPTDPTTERSAAFMFTYDRTADFRCTLDGADADCGSGIFGQAVYDGPLALGRHTFEVRALTGRNVSPPDSYAWTVAATPTEGDGPGDGGSDAGAGEGSTAESLPFDISGDVAGLAPGVWQPIVLTLDNPNATAIYVTSVVVEISEDSTPPGCPSETNIAVDQASGISTASPVRVAGHGSVVLRAHPLAPLITLVDRPWNQDACKGKSFALSYSGSAHS